MKKKKRKRSALTGQNHNEACELINASLMKCATFQVNLMTKGSRSLNGLFIAFDLFQTAAVKTIMFSPRRSGRGQTEQLIIPSTRPLSPKKDEKIIHPCTGLNDEWSHTPRTAVVNWDFMDDRRSLSLPLGGRAEWKWHRGTDGAALHPRRASKGKRALVLVFVLAYTRPPAGLKLGSRARRNEIKSDARSLTDRREGFWEQSGSCSHSRRHFKTPRNKAQYIISPVWRGKRKKKPQ